MIQTDVLRAWGMCIVCMRVRARASDLGQVSQFRSLPAELLQHTVIKLLLLFTAVTELGQARIVQAGPVLGERLGTVPLNLPAQTCVLGKRTFYILLHLVYMTSTHVFIAFNHWVFGHSKDVWWAVYPGPYQKGRSHALWGRPHTAYTSATFITARVHVWNGCLDKILFTVFFEADYLQFGTFFFI